MIELIVTGFVGYQLYKLSKKIQNRYKRNVARMMTAKANINRIIDSPCEGSLEEILVWRKKW